MTLLHMIYCSVTLTSILSVSLYYRQIFYFSIPMLYLYCPFTFTFTFYVSPLFMCALVGPALTDLNFSASEFEKTDVPLYEGTQRDY